MTENIEQYRAALSHWFEETEKTWVANREQLLMKFDEAVLQRWEHTFYSLKNEIDESLFDEQTFYYKLKHLYDELNSFYEIVFRKKKVNTNEAVPIGGHQLPPLAYAYDALEPVIAEEIMRLHHLKHHQSYVDGLNKAELQLQAAREAANFDLIKHWERELAFHGAGHYLHTIFWAIMTPNGGGEPDNPLMQAINDSFGSFEQMKKQFTKVAEHVEGGGWAILVWSPRSHRLEILMAEKHQNLSQWDVIPLLVLDVWEHAYYLQYKNERAKYVENWWGIVNWDAVNERFIKARTIMWQSF